MPLSEKLLEEIEDPEQRKRIEELDHLRWSNPYEHMMKTNQAFREAMADDARKTAAAEAAKQSAATEADRKQRELWHAQRELNGFTAQQRATLAAELKNCMRIREVTGADSTGWTEEEFEHLFRALEPLMRVEDDLLKEALAKRDRRIEALEKALETRSECLDSVREQVAGLESSRMDYCGVWDSGRSYQRNHIVTDHGSAWISLTDDNKARPGSDSNRWMLMVKRGGPSKS